MYLIKPLCKVFQITMNNKSIKCSADIMKEFITCIQAL